MRPRLIEGVPGLDPSGSPFERFRQFAERLAKVPKAEADKENKPSGSRKRGSRSKTK